MKRKKRAAARKTSSQPNPPKSKTDKIKVIQWDLEKDVYGRPLKQDGAWGPLTQGALDKLIYGSTSSKEIHRVIASSFADPEDVAAFERCKAQGKSDNECFKVGDNGEGCWSDSTKEGSGPSVALPPEDMEETWDATPPKYKEARLKQVEVVANNHTVLCEVKDRMPHRKNIKNGAGLDLNPDACAMLNLKPPVKAPATWQAVA